MALYSLPDYQASFVNWPFGSREEVNTDFQDGGHPGFPIRMI